VEVLIKTLKKKAFKGEVLVSTLQIEVPLKSFQKHMVLQDKKLIYQMVPMNNRKVLKY
jgi:hypothetical protein